MIRKKLAERLRYYRKSNNMTVYEAGNIIGKSGKTVSAWEVGRGQPDPDMLIKLCHICKIRSIAEFYGEDIPSLSPTESRLIEYYRQLNTSGREKLIERATELQVLGYSNKNV